MEKEKTPIEPEEFWCLIYSSKPQCKTCDGFGRNLNKFVRTEDCYSSKSKMRENLDLNKKINFY